MLQASRLSPKTWRARNYKKNNCQKLENPNTYLIDARPEALDLEAICQNSSFQTSEKFCFKESQLQTCLVVEFELFHSQLVLVLG